MTEFPRTPEDFEAMRDLETKHLADTLGRSIANLGYPVGMGLEPKRKALEHAAGVLFDRYLAMFRAIAGERRP